MIILGIGVNLAIWYLKRKGIQVECDNVVSNTSKIVNDSSAKNNEIDDIDYHNSEWFNMMPGTNDMIDLDLLEKVRRGEVRVNESESD